MSRIKVLIVDDSAFMRKVISNILSGSPDIEVLGTAKNGQEAIEKITLLRPDVVTMDIEMPVLNGLQALGFIMSECPTRVIMLTGAESDQGDLTMTAFQYGAVDFIQKPSGNISLDMEKIRDDLIRKITAAARVEVRKLGFIEEKVVKKEKTVYPARTGARKIIIIGSSTGGPRALNHIIPLLPSNLQVPVLIVQHMPAGFTKSLADRLDSQSMLRVREAADGDIIQIGSVFVAPGDFHMIVKQQKIDGEIKEVIGLTKGEKVQGVRPSVDVLLGSAVKIYGQDSIGIILTGMGSDGTCGIRKLKQAGGKVIAEDESTCVVYGMPRSVIEQKLADYILPVHEIARIITEIA
ncbi:MAG: chemotaxis response regulator protein-glutamate methylesterase [Candidatus Methanoperedens sp.]|nr:chemotaxis response regulator protein-glutamate methylesterase [Candidatus Methanoperedens sp.]